MTVVDSLLKILCRRIPALAAALPAIFWIQPAIAQDARVVEFERSVLPLLKEHCYECHSHEANSSEGGLVLDSRSGWQVGGDSGPAIIAGKPESSLLLKAVFVHR